MYFLLFSTFQIESISLKGFFNIFYFILFSLFKQKISHGPFGSIGIGGQGKGTRKPLCGFHGPFWSFALGPRNERQGSCIAVSNEKIALHGCGGSLGRGGGKSREKELTGSGEG